MNAKDTPLDVVTREAASYLSSVYPGAIPDHQAIGVQLAFVSGMLSMLTIMFSIVDEQGEDEDAAANTLEGYKNAIIARTLQLGMKV